MMTGTLAGTQMGGEVGPSPKSRYTHIDSLFTETVDWPRIETHLPDMLRVALSIREGRFTPSTILRRLGTYSRKNRLYHAVCLDLTRELPPLDYEAPILSTPPAQEAPSTAPRSRLLT